MMLAISFSFFRDRIAKHGIICHTWDILSIQYLTNLVQNTVCDIYAVI